MIASLRGNLLYSDESSVVVECGGVGIKCTVSKSVLSKLPANGAEVFLHTHMVVREDAMDLYGFSDLEELSAFKLVTSVNGVGAKIGIALLSQFTAKSMMLYIASGDAKALTGASGVGLKLAQRIILELKDKVGAMDSTDTGIELSRVNKVDSLPASSEAVEVLISLGYTKGEASLAVSKVDADLPAGELVKQALKILSRR